MALLVGRCKGGDPVKVLVTYKRTAIRKQESWRVSIVGDNGEEVQGGEKLHNRTYALELADELSFHRGRWPIEEVEA